MFKTKPSYTGFLEGILIGGSLAAAATFFLGTEEGKKMRKGMMHKYKEFERKAKHYRENVKKAVRSPVARKLKRVANKAVEENLFNVKKAVRSPVAKKLKRLATKAIAGKPSRKTVRKTKRKVSHKKAV